MAAGSLPLAQTSSQPPGRFALDFDGLVALGVAAAQRVSGDLWTDYNAHDPGVTIIEALAYVLTDVAYRVDHPIEDLIASSTAEGEATLEQQPLFTGDRILTCAPHSQADLRKCAYDNVLGLRNVWFMPTPTPGLLRPMAQLYHGSGATDPTQEKARILADLAACLDENRPLGVDFLYPACAPLRELRLTGRIDIAPEAAPETVLAELLYRIDQGVNPAPQLREIARDMDAGAAPEAIFAGPRLDFGWIPDETLRPYAIQPRIEDVIDTVLGTPGVTALASAALVEARTIDEEGPDGRLVTLGREDEDLKGLQVYSDGTQQKFDAGRVLAHLTHIEERARWEATYAAQKTNDMDYARLSLGNPGRRLSRYRSAQHLFPAVYKLGPDADGGGAATLQLKAYLMFFEQIVANALAQLSRAATLLSFAPQQRTYYCAPVCAALGPDPDAPPGIAPVLGALAGGDWRGDYLKALEALEANHDCVADRLNAARDALLARFGARLPDDRLARIWGRESSDPADFSARLAELKRQRLARLPDADGRRGMGFNLHEPAETELEAVIRCHSAHSGLLCLVEHVLLRPPAPTGGIGDLRIGKDFMIRRAPKYRALRLQCDGIALHLARRGPPRDWLTLSREFAACAAGKANFRVFATGGYEIGLGLFDGEKALFDVVETFPDRVAAREAVATIVRLGRRLQSGETAFYKALGPAGLPLDFLGHRVSVVLAAGEGAAAGSDYKTFVDGVVRARMPAHLRHRCYWLDAEGAAPFRANFEVWRKRLAQHREADGRPDSSQLRRAAVKLHRRIEELHARDLAARRPDKLFEPLS